MPSASRPIFASMSLACPCSRKASGKPILSTGTFKFSFIKNSFTADPAPPIKLFSSSVTRRLLVLASSDIKTSSIGFTKRISATVAFSLSPTSLDGATRLPKARSAIFFPLRLRIPFPMSSFSCVGGREAPVPLPRGYLTAAGPRIKHLVPGEPHRESTDHMRVAKMLSK